MCRCASRLLVLVSFIFCYVLRICTSFFIALHRLGYVLLIKLDDVFEGRRFAIRETGAEALIAVEAVGFAGHFALSI